MYLLSVLEVLRELEPRGVVVIVTMSTPINLGEIKEYDGWLERGHASSVAI